MQGSIYESSIMQMSQQIHHAISFHHFNIIIHTWRNQISMKKTFKYSTKTRHTLASPMATYQHHSLHIIVQPCLQEQPKSTWSNSFMRAFNYSKEIIAVGIGIIEVFFKNFTSRAIVLLFQVLRPCLLYYSETHQVPRLQLLRNGLIEVYFQQSLYFLESFRICFLKCSRTLGGSDEWILAPVFYVSGGFFNE